MKLLWTLLIGLLASGLVACGGAATDVLVDENAADAGAELSAPYGGSLKGVTLARNSKGFTLNLSSVPVSGSFLRVSLPEGTSVARQNWSGNENLLTLMVPTELGAEIGLVPLPQYSGGPVSVQAHYGPAKRRVSVPPTGTGSVVQDLVLEDLGGGTIGLSWTEHNQGDYNFDGLVTVTDLTPIGLHFQNSVFRNLDSSPLLTEYWVDGTADGLINVSDLTPIGQNYLANLASYYITRNGGAPVEVLRSQSTQRSGLPPVYNVAVNGTLTDSFVVSAVDNQGNIGANSAGNTAVDLRARLTITGADLFNLDGVGSGQFGPGKFSSRVIAPIDVVNRFNVIGQSQLLPDGVTTVVGGLQGYNRIYLDFRYAPTINLATGAPRGALSARGVSKDGADDPPGDDSGGSDDPPTDGGVSDGSGSDDGEGDPDGLVDPGSIVLSSIPIDLPLAGAVDVDVSIDIQPNTGGEGYIIFLDAVITYPGDDPDTVGFEVSYTRTWSSRLIYATGIGAIDTDNDDNFDDEIQFSDADRDCISDDDAATDAEDAAFEAAGYIRVEVETLGGRFLSYNEADGLIRFAIDAGDIDPEHSDDLAELIVGEHDFRVNAYTEFENSIDAEPADLLPGDLQLEDEVELKLYFYRNGEALVVDPKTSLRVEHVKRIAHGNPI